MPITPELSAYVQKARQSGLSDDAIRAALLKIGWNLEDVNRAVPARIPNFAPVPPRSAASIVGAVPAQLSAAHSVATKHRSRLPFIITAVLLLLIGATVYYFLPHIVRYLTIAPGPQVIVPTDMNPGIPSDGPSSVLPSGVSIEGWQVYQSGPLGFQVKIPPGWGETAIFKQIPGLENAVALIDLSKESRYSQSLGSGFDGASAVIPDAAILFRSQDSVDFLNQIQYQSLGQKTVVTINGLRVTRVVHNIESDPSKTGDSTEYYVFNRSGAPALVVQADYSSRIPSGELKEVLDTVLLLVRLTAISEISPEPFGPDETSVPPETFGPPDASPPPGDSFLPPPDSGPDDSLGF